jgi:hypothetical protein
MHGASAVQRVIEHVTVSSQLIGMDSRDIADRYFASAVYCDSSEWLRRNLITLPAASTGQRSTRLVNELANHRGQQIYFGIAATDGHDADRACIFERNSPPAFARPRGRQASPRYAGTSADAYLAV